jgi:class 3 adenylate cyclase
MAACQRCQEANPERARFCLACGAPLTPPGPQARKTVTVVFTDLVGSTELAQRLDPESLNRALTGYFRRARSVLEFHGATVQKFIGDAVMAVFGIPALHEDDALRAVRAALELRAGMTELNEEQAREAVALAERTDALETHGEALVDLAEVLSHGGRSDQAAAALGDPP